MEYHVQEHLHYAGLATWNHCECTQDIDGADIVLLGVPFDAGTTFRPGARFGPCGVRDQSLIACCFKYPWEYELKKEAKVIDYGDVGYWVGAYATDFMVKDTYETVKKVLDAGASPIIIGGDHTIPYGPVRALSERYGKLALIHFDSHQDSSPSQTTPDGKKNLSHANFAYDLQEEGCIQNYGSLKSGNIHYSGVFYKQEAAMMQIGTWYINMLLENIPNEDNGYASFNWGVCSMPNNYGITTENVVGGITPVSIGAYAKHPEEAWKFLAYITGAEGAQILAKTGIVPAWAGQEVLDIFDHFRDDHPNAPEGLSKYISGSNFIIEQPMDANGKAIASVCDELHSAIMTGSMSVEDAIAEYAAKAVAAGASEGE